MKQVITRIDDQLHSRVKACAATRGYSVNSFISEVLAEAVGEMDPRSAVRERARSTGRLRTPPHPARTPTQEEVRAVVPPGFGDAVIAALMEERSRR